jgi:acetylornithine deacetylase
MLNGHIDTVAIAGMHEPLSGRVENGRLFGRGSFDMKGGVAACFGAVRALRDAGVRLRGDLVVTGVADEEFESLGVQQVVRLRPTDAAIVTEPTALRTCVAHKGFVWLGVEAHGRAAHGSRPDLGVDANRAMARLIAALEPLHEELALATPHPLLGYGSFHVGTMLGGTGASTYAERCEATLERRTIPGESPSEFVARVTRAADTLHAHDPRVEYVIRDLLVREPFEAAPDSAIAESVRRARQDVMGETAIDVGDSVWMDAAILAAHGIDTVVIGPTGAGAHAAEEWVDVDSVVKLADILARAAIDYCEAV